MDFRVKGMRNMDFRITGSRFFRIVRLGRGDPDSLAGSQEGSCTQEDGQPDQALDQEEQESR